MLLSFGKQKQNKKMKFVSQYHKQRARQSRMVKLVSTAFAHPFLLVFSFKLYNKRRSCKFDVPKVPKLVAELDHKTCSQSVDIYAIVIFVTRLLNRYLGYSKAYYILVIYKVITLIIFKAKSSCFTLSLLQTYTFFLCFWQIIKLFYQP